MSKWFKHIHHIQTNGGIGAWNGGIFTALQLVAKTCWEDHPRLYRQLCAVHRDAGGIVITHVWSHDDAAGLAGQLIISRPWWHPKAMGNSYHETSPSQRWTHWTHPIKIGVRGHWYSILTPLKPHWEGYGNVDGKLCSDWAKAGMGPLTCGSLAPKNQVLEDCKRYFLIIS